MHKMDPKQARFSGEIVAFYEQVAKIENERRTKAGLLPNFTWVDAIRVAACQVARLPAEHVLDFPAIHDEMKKRPVKGPAKRTTKRT
jgi:hypothetical protein